MSIYNYSNLSISQLIEKIGKARFFNLPLMLKEVLTKINNKPQADSRPYKVYSATLSQSGTNDPVATVLENTLGVDIQWFRASIGQYYTTFQGAQYVNIQSFLQYFSPSFYTGTYIDTDGEEINITTTWKNASDFELIDGVLVDVNVEIRVYN